MVSISTKAVIRILAAGNVILLMILTFYVSRMLVSEYLDLERSQESNICWAAWVISSSVFFVLATLQTTADFFLFASNSDGAGFVETCKTWEKMSTLFITLLTLGLLFSILCEELVVGAELTLLLILGEIVGRTMSMILVHQYLNQILGDRLGYPRPSVVSTISSSSENLDPYIRYISASKVIHQAQSSSDIESQ